MADNASLKSRDFGGLREGRPAVLREPQTLQQVADAVAFAAEADHQLAVRGLGYSCNGQTISDGGMVLSLSQLRGIESIGEGQCDVLAGTLWSEVVDAALATGQVPPVLPDYLGLTVGGTLSIGGLGGTSFREGLISDQLLAADVVTADGAIVHCVTSENPELFDCIRGGAGQFGVIARARLRLVAAPAQVDVVRLIYPSVEAMLHDQLRLLEGHGLWHLGGWILPLPQGWTPCIELAFALSEAEGEGTRTNLPGGLQAIEQATQIATMPLRDFVYRLNQRPGFPCSRGKDAHAHPWMTAFLPASQAEHFLTAMLAEFLPDQMGPAGVIEVYPVPQDKLASPSLVWPDAERIFMISAFPCQLDQSATALARSEERNRRLFELALQLGGTGDPLASGLFLDPDDWQRQLRGAQDSYFAARNRFDRTARFKPLAGCNSSLPAPKEWRSSHEPTDQSRRQSLSDGGLCPGR